MNNLVASSQTWMFDAASASTASPPFPSAAGLPSNFYIVIDDISVTFTANAAADCTITVKTDDAQTLFVIGKSFLAGESDSFHITFPRGFVLPKGSKASGSGRIATPSNAAYTNAAMFTSAGAPTAGTVVVNYRYVAPSAVGV